MLQQKDVEYIGGEAAMVVRTPPAIVLIGRYDVHLVVLFIPEYLLAMLIDTTLKTFVVAWVRVRTYGCAVSIIARFVAVLGRSGGGDTGGCARSSSNPVVVDAATVTVCICRLPLPGVASGLVRLAMGGRRR